MAAERELNSFGNEVGEGVHGLIDVQVVLTLLSSYVGRTNGALRPDTEECGEGSGSADTYLDLVSGKELVSKGKASGSEALGGNA
jgi:hypothetical protein